MAELTIVKTEDELPTWRNAVLVKDQDTGALYVVTSFDMPWKGDLVETLVYPTDTEDADPVSTTINFVAGGEGMDRDDALADLSARIDDDALLTVAESAEIAQRQVSEHFEDIVKYLMEQESEALPA